MIKKLVKIAIIIAIIAGFVSGLNTVKAYNGDPAYGYDGYLLTLDEFTEICDKIGASDYLTDQEIAERHTVYNQWATNRHSSYSQFANKYVIFGYIPTRYSLTKVIWVTTVNLNWDSSYKYYPYWEYYPQQHVTVLNGFRSFSGTAPNYSGVTTQDTYYTTLYEDSNGNVTMGSYISGSFEMTNDIEVISGTKTINCSNICNLAGENFIPTVAAKINNTYSFYYLNKKTVYLSGSGDTSNIPSGDNGGGTITPSGDTPSGDISSSGEETTLEDINQGITNIWEAIINLPGTIINGFLDMLKNLFEWIMSALFEPDTEAITGYINDLTNNLNGNDLLALNTYIITKEMQLIGRENIGDFIISWNDIKLDYDNSGHEVKIIPASSINITEFVNTNPKLKAIYDIYIIIITATFIYAFASFLRNLLFKVLGLNWLGNMASEEEYNSEQIEVNAETGEVTRETQTTTRKKGNNSKSVKAYKNNRRG